MANVRRYKYAFAAVVIGQLLDLFTFLPAVARVGIEAELNPLIRDLYIGFGPIGPVLAKGVAILFVALAMQLIIARYQARLAMPALLGLGSGLIGAWSNVTVGLLA